MTASRSGLRPLDECAASIQKPPVHFDRAMLHAHGRKQGRIRDWYNLVVIALHVRERHAPILVQSSGDIQYAALGEQFIG